MEVGGDFYDAIVLPGDRLAAAIGDVEGHDMTATALMGHVRSALRAYLEVEREPDEVLRLLDRYVERHGGGRLTTVCLAVVAAGTGEVTLASAGHPAPLVIGPGPRAATVELTPGPPLGVGGPRPPAASLTLPTGATLAFYTDGLVERRVGGPEACLGTLLGAAGQRSAGGAGEVCDALLTAASGGARLEDDAAVLAVSRRPVPASPAAEGYIPPLSGTSPGQE